MITEYYTIKERGESLFKDRGSKFIGIALKVYSEDDVKAALASLRKEYYDARHHCYAYVIGADKALYRANDDGEPNHSAGDPILGQIHSHNVSDVLVVVVRYFGGTKLGVSGLINAYKIAADEALQHAGRQTVEIRQTVVLAYGYEATNDVMRLTNELDVEITGQQFDQNCRLSGRVKIDLLEQLRARVQLLNDTGTAVQLILDT